MPVNGEPVRIYRVFAVALMTAVVASSCAEPPEPAAVVGDCVLTVTGLGTAIDALPIVECSQPHQAEVFHVFDLEWEQPYNAQLMSEHIDSICLPIFEEYVGLGYWDSFLEFETFPPTEEGWELGQRETLCMLFEPDYERGTLVMLTGSQQGSRR